MGQFWPTDTVMRPQPPVSGPHGRFHEPKMLCHRPKIAVIVQQWPAVFDAPRSMVFRTAMPRRRKDRKLRAAAIATASPAIEAISKLRKSPSPLSSGPLAGEALEHLAQHQISNNDLVRA